MKNFATQCLPSPAKDSISVLANGISKTNRQYCGSTRRKMNFIVHSQCMQENKPQLDRIMNNMTGQWVDIHERAELQMKVPLICW